MWGEQGTAQTPFGFTGEPTDQNGLVHLRARYYNPALGVFPSLDPLEGSPMQPLGINRYAYVNGDPINLADPSGMVGENPTNWNPCSPSRPSQQHVNCPDPQCPTATPSPTATGITPTPSPTATGITPTPSPTASSNVLSEAEIVTITYAIARSFTNSSGQALLPCPGLINSNGWGGKISTQLGNWIGTTTSDQTAYRLGSWTRTWLLENQVATLIPNDQGTRVPLSAQYVKNNNVEVCANCTSVESSALIPEGIDNDAFVITLHFRQLSPDCPIEFWFSGGSTRYHSETLGHPALSFHFFFGPTSGYSISGDPLDNPTISDLCVQNYPPCG